MNLARIIFVGDDWYGSNATSLRNAILRAGHSCLTIDSSRWSARKSLRVAAHHTSATYSRVEMLNRRLRTIANGWKPDVTVVFKGLFVTAETVAALPGTSVHYHPDDSGNPENVSDVYTAAEPLYSFHVTTKSFNVPELRARGVKSPLFVRCAYDLDWHVPVRAERRYFLGFIGTRRPDRLDLVKRLSRRYGREFLVCGSGWRWAQDVRRHASVLGPQYGFQLAETVGVAPLQLGLLNSANRDLHTCRSYEIPGAGGCLLSERTDEHLEMLEEEKEALYFSTSEELQNQLERLRQNPRLVRSVAAKGSRRIRSTHNTYDDRWKQIYAAIRA